jgi:hypothetical protein
MDASPTGTPPARAASLSRLISVSVLVFSFAALVGFVLAAADACPWQSVCGPIIDDDRAQGRLDTALPAPDGTFSIEQTFIPAADGLAELELLLVRYGDTAAPPGAALTLTLLEDTGRPIAEERLPAGGVIHNQTHTLRFDPQPDSAGRPYRLVVGGTPGNQASVWGYSLDVAEGEMRLVAAPGAVAPSSNARDLRYTSRTQLLPGSAIAELGRILSGSAGLMALALLFLLGPGCMLLLATGPWRWDAGAWWGAAPALGASLWPLVWLWLSLAGVRFSGPLLWGMLAAVWASSALLWLRARRAEPRAAAGAVGRRSVRLSHVLLLLLLVAALLVRLLAVRGLVFPPWVDSSRHGLITAVMAANGSAPNGYEPYLPVARFPYHYGFHAIAASLLLMTGRPLPDLLLVLGQLLNALIPLTVYAAGWFVTRRRDVGLLAAFLVALPFFFPAYYATWGRMTQLGAMLVLPVLLGLTWRAARSWARVWPLVGLLAAGVFMLHFRVFVFYVPFGLLAGALALSRRRPWPLLTAGGLALLLVAPRAAQLLAVTDPGRAVQASIPGYNDFPTGYITAGWERGFLLVAVAAVGIALVAALNRRRWAAFPLWLAVWVGLLALALSGERLGLPETSLININSLYISVFAPLALLLAAVTGGLVWEANRWLRRVPHRWRGWFAVPAGAAAGLLLAVLAVFGARQQVGIINGQTVLAGAADREAIAWAADSLPDDALVAVNSWLWLGNTWAAGDGGAWLVPMARLEVTTPPIDHIYNSELFARVRAFNEEAKLVKDWSTPEVAAWLREQGVTHVMAGQRGGFFDPAALSRNAALEMIYARDGVFFFRLRAA